jgi:hypothetical protein
LGCLLGGGMGARADTVPGNHFVIVSFGAPRSELLPKVDRAAKLMEDSRLTLLSQGYPTDHRTRWPMEVRVHPMREGLYGSFAQELPWPLDVNTGYFNLNTWAFEQPDMPGTAIHEYYHFVQARYTGGMLAGQASNYGWVKEAASTWIEERAPETIGVFRNSFFQAHRHNLFTGLYPGLSAKHGYGKAPIMKYVADRWGTDQVRGIFELVGSGVGAVDAVLQGIPEAPEVWWPDLLTKYMKGEIISLAPEDLPPPTAESPLKPGVWPWTRSSSDLRSLGAQFSQFTPDPDSYGTGTTLVVKLPPALQEAGFKILPFRMDASGSWEEQGGVVDSLVIEGKDLRLGRRYGFFMLHTAPVAPYLQSWTNQYLTEMGYTEGDWMPQDVAVVSNAIEYVRPDEDDDTEIEVAENIVSVFESLAGGGIWKRSASDPNHYVWEPTQEFAGTLAAYDVAASSEAKLGASGDSLYINAMFDVAPPSGSGGGSPEAAFLGEMWRSPDGARGGWAGIGFMGAAVLLSLTGLALRRNRKVLAMAAAGAAGLVFWGCDLGTISFTAKFRYEFRLANPALTASAEDPAVPLVELSNGTGTFIVDRYRSEWWKYIRDEDGEVVDSVAQVRTATGQATVDLGAVLFQDGIVTNDDDEDVMSAASALLQLPAAALSEVLKAAGHR